LTEKLVVSDLLETNIVDLSGKNENIIYRMFCCNITGQKFDLTYYDKHRELGVRFGYNNRFRAICYVLTKLLFGECKILSELEENKNITGIGMSDSGWADICAQKFNYVNTFYHIEPFLNIYNEDHVKKYNNLDFIISSDVFEHIDPFPNIQFAFDNLYKMLRHGGHIIFSVPYTEGEHLEHYPNLYKYEILREDNKYILYNTTIDGVKEKFTNLRFHGGPGSVLEMRLFSKKSIVDFLKKSGFVDIVFHEIDKAMNKHGIFWSAANKNDSALIITAKKI
jgi:SAM-dependent methyltransferase